MKTFDSLAACKYVYRVREIRSIVITARIINICAKEYISGPWYWEEFGKYWAIISLNVSLQKLTLQYYWQSELFNEYAEMHEILSQYVIKRLTRINKWLTKIRTSSSLFLITSDNKNKEKKHWNKHYFGISIFSIIT